MVNQGVSVWLFSCWSFIRKSFIGWIWKCPVEKPSFGICSLLFRVSAWLLPKWRCVCVSGKVYSHRRKNPCNCLLSAILLWHIQGSCTQPSNHSGSSLISVLVKHTECDFAACCSLSHTSPLCQPSKLKSKHLKCLKNVFLLCIIFPQYSSEARGEFLFCIKMEGIKASEQYW